MGGIKECNCRPDPGGALTTKKIVMKLRFTLSLLACLCCLVLTAQTSERVKNRAERRANNHVDRQVDRAVDGAVNAIGGLFKKKKAQQNKETEASAGQQAANTATEESVLDVFNGGQDWEPYTNPVSFSLQIGVQEVKKNGKETNSTILMAVTEDRFGIHMLSDQVDGGSSRMILNTQDGKTTLVTTDKKGEQSAFRMRIPNLNKSRLQATADVDGRFTFEATGERKVVNGYNCEKYIIRDLEEGHTTTSWVTKDLQMNAQEIFANFAGMAGANRGKMPQANGLAGAYEGFPIESTTTDGKTTFIMTFSDIKIGADQMDKKVLDLTGVEVQDMGF